MGYLNLRFLLILILLLVSCSKLNNTTSSTESPTILSRRTPSLEATATLTSVPSLKPELRIANGDQALFNGDYSLAQTEYTAAFLSSGDPLIQSAAVWGLGRANLQAGNYGGALNSFNQLIADFPDSSHRIQAHLQRAEILMYLERYTEAIEAYTAYLALSPGIIDCYTFERRADGYVALGQYENAINDYKSAILSSHIGDDTWLQIKLASGYEAIGDSTSALGIYDSIFNTTTDSHLKAQMDLFRGRLSISLGQADQAFTYFRHSVESYPLEYESYSALVALVDAGVPVDDLQRGLVDYFAGQYGYAIDAFTRYAVTNPENDGTVHYYRALALRDSGLYQEALDAFSLFTQNYSSNYYWSVAWEDKADLQWFSLGDYDGAVATLMQFTHQTSDISTIPKILLDAGRILEREGNLDDAVVLWESIADQHPGSEFVQQSLFLAGILNYRMGEYEKALLDFQRCFLLASALEDQARAVYWTGKSYQILGDDVSAKESFLHAASIDQTNFYSLRAQDMLFNRNPFNLPALQSYQVALDSERLTAETWMRVTFNLPPDTNMTDLGIIASDGRFIRGNEFYALDMMDAALLEYEDLRSSISESPIDNYRLGNYLLKLGLYKPAIFSFRQVLTLAGMNEQSDTLAAPRYFNLVRYGLYYQDLIIPQSLSVGFDPVFIYSIVRQESLFDRYAGSGQGALGLMQITPSTALHIVDGLGWPPDFTTNDLFRPKINIGLGISHLSDLKMGFSNELFPTLAAYNAGQNAAVIWRDLSGPDPDLFLETIRYPETHDYIRSIYEIYFLYNFFYSPSP